jgi:hypothetical protein
VVTYTAGDPCTTEGALGDLGYDCGNIAFTGLWCVEEVCVEASVAQVGEACDFPMGAVVCAGSFTNKAYCDFSGATTPEDGGTCVANPVVGEACEGDCVDSFCHPSGVCTAYLAEGAPCESGQCGEDTYCTTNDAAEMVCVSFDEQAGEDTVCTE